MPNYERGRTHGLEFPTLEQVDEILDAEFFYYEAGQFPTGLSDYAMAFVTPDGGLLNALIFLREALRRAAAVN